MNDALAGMIPYDSIGLYEQPKPRFFFKMPRVVPEQKSKFESDELFRRLSRECEVSNFWKEEKNVSQEQHLFLSHCCAINMEYHMEMSHSNVKQ